MYWKSKVVSLSIYLYFVSLLGFSIGIDLCISFCSQMSQQRWDVDGSHWTWVNIVLKIKGASAGLL